MSHLLSTMNEDAADAIDNPPALPDIGTIVVYIPRAGMMRMGRREFPAIVLAGNAEEQTLELLVTMEPEDMIHEQHVVFQRFDQKQHCWRHVRKEQAEEHLINDNARMTAMANRLAALEKLIYGDYDPLDISVYHVMQDFEGRLADLADVGRKGKKG